MHIFLFLENMARIIREFDNLKISTLVEDSNMTEDQCVVRDLRHGIYESSFHLLKLLVIDELTF